MNDTSKALSIIAYYLSEYDMDAVKCLGYKTRSQAIDQISEKFGRNHYYLKLRRDEFDALPFSHSHRKGWRNREPAKDVLEMGKWLHRFSFDEITDLVKDLLLQDIQINPQEQLVQKPEYVMEPSAMSEEEMEHILNAVDKNATIAIVTGERKKRIIKNSIILNLKKLYHGTCQICGCNPFGLENIDISEAHHISFFSESKNNDASNLIIVCPNHHRLIHKYKPVFCRETLSFQFKDGHEEKVIVNYHL